MRCLGGSHSRTATRWPDPERLRTRGRRAANVSGGPLVSSRMGMVRGPMRGSIGSLLIVVAAWGCSGGEHESQAPELPMADLVPLAQQSSVTVPISASVSDLLEFADEKVPKRFDFGSIRLERVDRFGFDVNRDGRLELRVPVRARGTVPVDFLPDPRIDITGTLVLVTGVGIGDDFSLLLQYADARPVHVDADATWMALPFGVEPQVREFIVSHIPELLGEVDDALRDWSVPGELARALWREACAVIDVGEGVRVALRPNGIRATDFAFGPGDELRWQLGMDLVVEAYSASLEQGERRECGVPSRLRKDRLVRGHADLWLPVRIGYGHLNEVLERYVAGQAVGPGGRIRIESATVGSVEERLAVLVELSGREDGWAGWLSRRASVRVYVLGRPVLSSGGEEGERVAFQDVELDTGSRDVLLETLGEGAEPFLVNFIRSFEVDLSAVYDVLLDKFGAFLEESEVPGIAVVVGEKRLALAAVDVGPEDLRVVLHGALEDLVPTRGMWG